MPRPFPRAVSASLSIFLRRYGPRPSTCRSCAFASPGFPWNRQTGGRVISEVSQVRSGIGIDLCWRPRYGSVSHPGLKTRDLRLHGLQAVQYGVQVPCGGSGTSAGRRNWGVVTQRKHGTRVSVPPRPFCSPARAAIGGFPGRVNLRVRSGVPGRFLRHDVYLEKG